MKHLLLAAALLSLLVPSLALASGTSSTPSAPYSSSFDEDVDPLKVTQTLRCKVLSINNDGSVLIVDVDTKKTTVLARDAKVSIRAQDKNAFDGRKKLTVADLKAGHEIKVLHRPATGEMLSIKVLKQKS